MIKKITWPEADCIIHSRRPFGLFYTVHNGAYIGIDNSNGHAWTEGFHDLRRCKKWLRDPSVAAPSLVA